jgi:hypothetical protein
MMRQQTMSMNQEIFNIGLDVETISLYLLCCGLADSDTAISVKNLLPVWNSSEAALNQGLDELENRNIISRILSDQEGKHIYKLTDLKQWKL